MGSVDKQNQAVDDETLAATMLITADCAAGVERVARRVHRTGARAASPLVLVEAAGLSCDTTMLAETCGTLLDQVGGGSLLITDVEHMPAFVQNCWIETFAGCKSARDPVRRMCLIAGTTTNLHDRIAQGTFSERLFYRLNSVHQVEDGGALGAVSPVLEGAVP